MMESALLVIEDDQKMRRLFDLILGAEGYRVTSVPSAEEGIRKLTEQNSIGGYDLVVTDLQMSGMTGLDVLEHVKKISPHLPVLIVTGFGTVKTAVEAMKKGAFDYITKPVDNEELKLLIRRALEVQRLYRHHEQLSQEMRERFSFDRVIGNSEEICKVKKLLRDVAPTDHTVLITGESGTGKELLARAIHYTGRRARYPMVAINCGAIPETLLESELFGYVRGAFTDAKTSRPGRLKMADGGTVFLDEIAELSPMTQVKMLRVLQEKEIDPLGSSKSIKVDIRIIAATNKDLIEQVRKGHFREDLYYRINVFPVHVPALRDRAGDIPLLVQFFINHYSLELSHSFKGFSPNAMTILESYPWPGNVRELQNLVERMMIICKGQWVEAEDLPQSLLAWDGRQYGDGAGEKGPRAVWTGKGGANPEVGRTALLSLGLSLDQLEALLIREALEKTSGNVTQAARLLKTSRNTLRYRIKKYGLLESK